jgi:hypothetical protein
MFSLAAPGRWRAPRLDRQRRQLLVGRLAVLRAHEPQRLHASAASTISFASACGTSTTPSFFAEFHSWR